MSNLNIINKKKVYQCVPPTISVDRTGEYTYNIKAVTNSQTPGGYIYLRNTTRGTWIIPSTIQSSVGGGRWVNNFPYLLNIKEFADQGLVANGETIEIEIEVINHNCPSETYEQNIVRSNTVQAPVQIAPVVQPKACLNFRYAYTGTNPSDKGMITFIDCENVQRKVGLTWDESDGRYNEIDICALDIISVEGSVNDITDYGNQPRC